nr:cadherin-like beta sandwich domain-containing protein [Lysinibacillus sp. BF-4]
MPTSFDKTKTAYTAVVPNDSTKLELTATQANATLYVNGEKYTSASTKSIDLVVGKNTVEIKVVAPDNKTEKVYTIEVTRASENASAVNTLNSLTLSEGTLGGGFKADTNDNASSLTASVKNATQEIVITPVATNSKALVDVTVASGSGLKVEKIGSAYKITGLKEKGASTPVTNDITISVKPENGGAAQDYVLKVTRANATASDLASLTGFTGLTQITDFASTKTDYAFNVTNGTGTIAITPAGAPSGSTVTVNGKVTSGTENVDLKVGENVITVKVTAENQINSRTYTIKVNRASASASSVDTLSGLTVNGATLNETFAEATTAYTTTVLNSVQDLTITPTAKDSKAVVTVKAIKGTTGTNKLEVVQSGSSYTIKGLAEGDNTVTISVQPENAGTAKDYTLTVTRVAATASDSALLSGIALNAGGAITLTNWNNTVESYTVPTKVANATNTITVTPTVASGAKAEVTVNGTKVNASGTGVLNVGENTIQVKVTAPNGVATKTYTFKVTRQGETLGKEAGVTLASDKGTLTHNALATVTSGAVTADGSLVLTNDVSSLNFTATPADAQAAVVVTYDADGTGSVSTPVTLTKNAQGTYTIANVAEGKGELKVTVTSEDTNVSNTVTIEVDKAKTGATGLASVAAISLDNGATEIKNFDPETTSYTVPVAHLPGTVTPLVSKGHADQTVTYKLNGKVITSATDLLVGDNTLVVTVVSPDKKVTKEYTVIIKRVSGNLSELAALTVNNAAAAVGTPVAATIAADVSDYKFTAVASPKATVKVTAKNAVGQTIIVSPGANNAYTASALTTGVNTITVQVTAEDGVTVKTYTIAVTKTP